MKKQESDSTEAGNKTTEAKDRKEIHLKPDSKNEDENFFKIFMGSFEKGLGGIKSQQLRVILWLIKHMSLKNEVRYSYREIADASHTSLQTVASTIQNLQKHDFLCRDGKKLIINPRAVFKGRHEKRIQAIYFYDIAKETTRPLSEAERKEVEDELEHLNEYLEQAEARKRDLEELTKLEKSIKSCTQRQKKLNKRLKDDSREKKKASQKKAQQESRKQESDTSSAVMEQEG